MNIKFILTRFKLKLQSCSYQILDYTFLLNVQYPHALVNSCGRKSSAFQKPVVIFKSEVSLFPHAL